MVVLLALAAISRTKVCAFPRVLLSLFGGIVFDCFFRLCGSGFGSILASVMLSFFATVSFRLLCFFFLLFVKHSLLTWLGFYDGHE